MLPIPCEEEEAPFWKINDRQLVQGWNTLGQYQFFPQLEPCYPLFVFRRKLNNLLSRQEKQIQNNSIGPLRRTSEKESLKSSDLPR